MSTRISQVAICSRDHHRSTDFYSSVLGYEHIFGTTAFRGELAEKIQGMRNAASTTRWLVDDRDRFQLEVFQFETPAPRALRPDNDVSDLGYNRIIVAVRSLGEAMARASRAGVNVTRMKPAESAAGPAHARLTDPDGIIIELVEMPEQVQGTRNAQIVGLGVTVPELEVTAADMCQGFGFAAADDLFEHGDYWPQCGRLERHRTLQLDDMYLVVSQYRDARSRIDGYRLADVGIMNFAIIFPDKAALMTCYECTRRMGMAGNCEPVFDGDSGVVYNNDRQGYSVEMMVMNNRSLSMFGFSRPGLVDRLLMRLMEMKSRAAYPRHVARNEARHAPSLTD